MGYQKHITYKDPLSQEQMIAALACYHNDEDAKTYLESQGYGTTLEALAKKRLSASAEVHEMREHLAPQREGALANDMLDIALSAAELQQYAIDHCLKRIQENKGRYSPEVLSKIARDIAQVATQNVDKRLALQGRPTTITAHRDFDELTNALVGLGVAEVVQVQSREITEGQDAGE